METVDVVSALPLPPRTPDFLFSVFKKKMLTFVSLF